MVQLRSSTDKDDNLRRAEALVRSAASEGAELTVLPEKFNLLGSRDDMVAGAEPIDGRTASWAAGLAAELGTAVVAGSFLEKADDGSFFNTSLLFDSSGELVATYRKIHMFDVEVGGMSYRESELETAGSEIVVADLDGTRIGMAICYDLRFPELFRILALKGAQLVVLPAAFTHFTGKDHWELLVRTRAVEDQVFMVAADQVGKVPPNHTLYGHSIVVDPWGKILAEAADGDSFAVADLNFNELERIRKELPALANRQPTAYEWPQGPVA